MKKEIYILFTQGGDGRFTMNAYETFEKANDALNMHIDAQKYLDGLGTEIHVDYHAFERLVMPEFVFRPGAIMTHVTFDVLVDGKINRTERYIVKTELN